MPVTDSRTAARRAMLAALTIGVVLAALAVATLSIVGALA
jgi:hypothetical protein